MIKNYSQQKGFTLLEMIVSIAIFSIVALVAAGSLLRIMDANKKAIHMKNVMNNVNFALESMSREIRVGGNYNKITTGNGWVFQFTSPYTNSAGNCSLVYAYKYEKVNNVGTLKKAQESPDVLTCSDASGLVGVFNDNEFFELISPNITIDAATITVDNTDQPKVFITLSGTSNLTTATGINTRTDTEFKIQTTISQRIE